MKHDEVMELILERYKNPPNRGPIPGAGVIQHGGNPGCGDVVTVYVDAGEDGVVRRLSFEGEGCMVSQAGTSIILEKSVGKTLSDIGNMAPEILSGILGERIVKARPACAYLGFNTLKLAVKKMMPGDMKSALQHEAQAE